MIRFGILGCGNIARKFAECVVEAVDNAQLVCAAARDRNRAEQFAARYDIPHAYGSYDELVDDSGVDVVYIATPHSHHRGHALLCLENGKAVLCEKPAAVNLREASDMVSLAREKNLFLMEAMWMRFLPVMTLIRKHLREGALGEVESVSADFSFKGSNDPRGRLLNPHLAGGALLDVGIYPLSFSLMVFGEQPVKIQGLADIGSTGVDESNTFTLEFSSGRKAFCSSSVVKGGSQLARVQCQNGAIEIPTFWKGESFTIVKNGSREEVKSPFDCNGFEYEVRDAVNCIAKQKTESSIMPLGETLKTMSVMDQLRSSWNLEYPMDSR